MAEAAPTPVDAPDLRHFGRGGQAALCLHCSLGHASAWAGLGAALDGRLAITAPDLPGHGRGVPWVSGRDMAAVAVARAAEVIVAEHRAPVDVIGHSYGAVVALRLALEQPRLVRRLVLIEPTLLAALRPVPDGRGTEARDAACANADTAAAGTIAGERAAFDRLAALLAAGRRDDAAALFLRDWGTGQPWQSLPPEQRAYIADRIHVIVDSAPVVWDDCAGLLAPGRLERLPHPVLLMEGERSPATIAAINDALAGRLAEVERVRVPGAGHMAPITHAAAVAGPVARFLNL